MFYIKVLCISGLTILFFIVQILIGGSINSKNGDLAERIPLSQYAMGEDVRPSAGDVVVVDQTGLVRKSSKAHSPFVVGVVSTKPAHVLRNMIKDSVPVALSGIVPCKVTNENGVIRPGDLLVTSSTPGHAMKASSPIIPGTVIGKALDAQDEEHGTVLMLVMMR